MAPEPRRHCRARAYGVRWAEPALVQAAMQVAYLLVCLDEFGAAVVEAEAAVAAVEAGGSQIAAVILV